METVLRFLSDPGRFPFFIVVFVGATFVVFQFATNRLKRFYSTICMCIWGFGLFYVTWLSRTPVWETRVNLIPFQQDDTIFTFANITNYAMFIPYPMLLYGMLQRKYKISVLAVAGIALSLAIEILQLFTHRGVCDIDDFILNSMGAITGALLTRLLMKIEKQNKACMVTSGQTLL